MPNNRSPVTSRPIITLRLNTHHHFICLFEISCRREPWREVNVNAANALAAEVHVVGMLVSLTRNLELEFLDTPGRHGRGSGMARHK